MLLQSLQEIVMLQFTGIGWILANCCNRDITVSWRDLKTVIQSRRLDVFRTTITNFRFLFMLCDFKLTFHKNSCITTYWLTFLLSYHSDTDRSPDWSPKADWSPKGIFSNNQAVLECVITGQDKTVVDNTEITWQTDGQKVNSTTEPTKAEGSQYSKTSTMTCSRTEWERVNKASCSAGSEDTTPRADCPQRSKVTKWQKLTGRIVISDSETVNLRTNIIQE